MHNFMLFCCKYAKASRLLSILHRTRKLRERFPCKTELPKQLAGSSWNVNIRSRETEHLNLHLATENLLGDLELAAVSQPNLPL